MSSTAVKSRMASTLDGDQRVLEVEAVIAGAALEPVVAEAAVQLVGAAVAVQLVVADQAVEDVGLAVAGEDVGQAIAGAVDRVGAGQGQVLDVRAEGEVDRALHLVGAADDAGLDHDVAGIVDDVGVVAERRRSSCRRRRRR